MGYLVYTHAREQKKLPKEKIPIKLQNAGKLPGRGEYLIQYIGHGKFNLVFTWNSEAMMNPFLEEFPGLLKKSDIKKRVVPVDAGLALVYWQATITGTVPVTALEETLPRLQDVLRAGAHNAAVREKVYEQGRIGNYKSKHQKH
jgi:hypothetical protein